VAITPPKVYGVPAHQTQIVNLKFLGDSLWLQNSFPSPLIYALRAGTVTTQSGRAVTTLFAVSPGNSDGEIILLFDFSRLDFRPMSLVHTNSS
jgi:hypothetical protein